MITIKNLSKSYENITVLKDLNLEIRDREILGILGRNGSGKSTLIHLILNLIKKDSGKIEIDEKAFEEIKGCIGYVPQEISLYTNLSVKRNIEFFLRTYKTNISKKDVNLKNYNIINYFKIEKIMHYKITKLSGGQKGLINFICGIIHEPKILLLDEVSTGLDVETSNKITGYIRKLKEEQKTIIIISHNLNELEKICSRFILLENGKIKIGGNFEQLKDKVNYKKVIIIKTDYENILVKKLNSKKLEFFRQDKYFIIYSKEEINLEKGIKFFKNEKIKSLEVLDLNLEYIYLYLTNF